MPPMISRHPPSADCMSPWPSIHAPTCLRHLLSRPTVHWLPHKNLSDQRRTARLLTLSSCRLSASLDKLWKNLRTFIVNNENDNTYMLMLSVSWRLCCLPLSLCTLPSVVAKELDCQLLCTLTKRVALPVSAKRILKRQIMFLLKFWVEADLILKSCSFRGYVYLTAAHRDNWLIVGFLLASYTSLVNCTDDGLCLCSCMPGRDAALTYYFESGSFTVWHYYRGTY